MLVDLPSLAGEWVRSLLLRADGSRDATSVVTWMQVGPAYLDLRQPAGWDVTGPLATLDRAALLRLLEQEAFAGTLSLEGDLAEWHRRIDLTLAAPLGDRGRLRFVGRRLVEDGVLEPYVEHWEPGRDGTGSYAWLRDDTTTALLLRVGSRFGWARGRSADVAAEIDPPADLADLLRQAPLRLAVRVLDVEVSMGRVDGRRWVVERSSLPHCVGRELDLQPDGVHLHTTELGPDAAARRRTWLVTATEGDLFDRPGGLEEEFTAP